MFSVINFYLTDLTYVVKLKKDVYKLVHNLPKYTYLQICIDLRVEQYGTEFVHFSYNFKLSVQIPSGFVPSLYLCTKINFDF